MSEYEVVPSCHRPHQFVPWQRSSACLHSRLRYYIRLRPSWRRIGRYISLPEIEAQFAPDNYTYSHSILYTFDTYTQTGINVTTKLNDHWVVQVASLPATTSLHGSGNPMPSPRSMPALATPGHKAQTTSTSATTTPIPASMPATTCKPTTLPGITRSTVPGTLTRRVGTCGMFPT